MKQDSLRHWTLTKNGRSRGNCATSMGRSSGVRSGFNRLSLCETLAVWDSRQHLNRKQQFYGDEWTRLSWQQSDWNLESEIWEGRYNKGRRSQIDIPFKFAGVLHYTESLWEKKSRKAKGMDKYLATASSGAKVLKTQLHLCEKGVSTLGFLWPQ